MHLKMSSKLYILLLIFLWSSTCFGSQKSNKDTEQEYEIIIQILPNLLYPKPPPPPPPFVGKANEKRRFNDSINNEIERFKNRIDTTDFYLFLQDSLTIPSIDAIEYLSDSMYYGLGKYLKAKTLTSSPIDINLIDNQIKYKVKQTKLYNENIDKNFGYLGFAEFSRIVFNSNYTQALFYFEHYYDEDSGTGALIFVEKQNGKWEIIRNDIIWIS